MAEAEAAALSRLARQSGIRSTILETARTLAERVGVPNLSLSAVAAEAGLNPSTVFGHFRNKDDLLLAIVAEDLGALAAAMRVRLASAGGARDVPAAGATPASERALTEPASVAFPSVHAADNTTRSPDARAESPPDWDSTAVSPISQGLSVLQESMDRSEHGLKEAEAGRAVALSEESMKLLFDRMETFERQQKHVIATLMQRVEEAERRQRSTIAELRAAIHESSTRMEILESARRTAEASSTPAAESASIPGGPESQEPAADSGDDSRSYRDAAERAASAAATLAALDSASPQRSTHRVRLRRQHWIFAACTTLMLFVLGGSIAFSLGEAHGHHLAVAPSQIRTDPLHRELVSLAGSEAAHLSTRAPRAQPGPRMDATTELLLGLRYLRGEGLAPDASKAAELIGYAAKQHGPVAEYWLGTLYQHGDGVPENPTAAVRWYYSAAIQGNRKAMHAMGVACAQGTGTRKDYAEAARWFSKAAQIGLMNSEFNLGVLYERGLGVPQSLTDAYRWYAIAAGQGDQESRARVEALKTQLAPEALAAAERAAAAFHPAKPEPRANDTPEPAALASAHQGQIALQHQK